MIYGYARVSTLGQAKDGNSLEEQEKRLRENGATEIYVDTFTGTKLDRPEFQKLLSVVEKGDTIVATKLDRVSRSASQGIQLVDELLSRGVTLNILNMGIMNDSPTGKLVRNVMFSFAEFERDMIVQRTTEGKSIAKARLGDAWREGRKPLSKEIQDKIAAGIPYTELGISQSVWYKYRKRLCA